jgi:diacylglycerol kinase (ATP)
MSVSYFTKAIGACDVRIITNRSRSRLINGLAILPIPSILRLMASFKKICIIYNPISTGSSRHNAEEFAKRLKKKLPASTTLEVLATKHAGHGKVLAHDYAKAIPNCLIISSSGDGGYHEIVNGVIESGSTTASVGLLPSGNANDHYNALHTANIIRRIVESEKKLIDVLEVTIRENKKVHRRYAHSYAGIGLTPDVGKELNKRPLNRLTEVWIVVKQLLSRRSVKIRVNKKVYRYDSLVFSNIPRMSKVLSLSKTSSICDGMFEVNGIQKSNFYTLLRYLVRASTVGLEEEQQVTTFTFTCLQALSLQIDGEIYECKKGAGVTISCLQKRLPTII